MFDSQIASHIKGNIEAAKDRLKSEDWIVLGFQENPLAGSFSYSVGLSTRFGHPEIVMVGFPPDQSLEIINDAGALIRERGADFSRPILSSRIVRGYDVAFRPLSAAAARDGFQYAKKILDARSIAFVQLFLPDKDGFFPWSRKADRRMAKVQLGMFKHEGPLPMAHAPEN